MNPTVVIPGIVKTDLEEALLGSKGVSSDPEQAVGHGLTSSHPVDSLSKQNAAEGIWEDSSAPGDCGDGNPAESTVAEADDLWRSYMALYGSHFLSTWGERAWEFAIGLVLLQVYPESLALVAAFGLVDGAAQVVLGAFVGQYVDRTPRLQAACTMYVAQNAAVAVSGGFLLVLFRVAAGGAAWWGCVAGAIGAGAASSLGSLGSTLAVERNWAKALTRGDSTALAQLNSGMRRIDLSCLIASPIMAGLLLTYGGAQVCVLVLVAWNLAAWAPETMLLRWAQHWAPHLKQAKVVSPPGAHAATLWGKLWAGWAVYAAQPALPAAVALALLYFTVMSLGLLMTAYLKWLGMSEAELSFYRGLGALSGIAATVTFPLMHARLGLVASGLVGIWSQFGCLAAAVLPAALDLAGVAVPAPAASHVLVAGLVASRFGLWTYDLAVTQLIQQTVPDDQLGAVNGVQGSLQSLFQTAAYVLGLAVPRPQQFHILMFTSVTAVLAAAVLYTTSAAKRRLQEPQRGEERGAERRAEGRGVYEPVAAAGPDVTDVPPTHSV